jgi:hypothetical protein
MQQHRFHLIIEMMPHGNPACLFFFGQFRKELVSPLTSKFLERTAGSFIFERFARSEYLERDASFIAITDNMSFVFVRRLSPKAVIHVRCDEFDFQPVQEVKQDHGIHAPAHAYDNAASFRDEMMGIDIASYAIEHRLFGFALPVSRVVLGCT